MPALTRKRDLAVSTFEFDTFGKSPGGEANVCGLFHAAHVPRHRRSRES